MEFTIRVLVVIILIVIAFVVFVALIAVWGGDANAMVKGLMDWFSQIITGKAKLPAPDSSQNPGGASSGGSSIPWLPAVGGNK
jgi:hypothetical protein